MTKIVCFSDSHGTHGLGKVGDYSAFESADIVVFAGDVCVRTSPNNPWNDGKDEMKNFLTWYSKMPVTHKIYIDGNHDFFCEKNDEIAIKNMFEGTGVTRLNDSGVEIDGIKFWGSPITPFFFNWAWNRLPGEDIEKHWSLIPSDTDVVICHGPVNGIHDVCDYPHKGFHAGCPTLRKHIFERIKPQAFICGHIHGSYGTIKEENIVFVNCSIVGEDYIQHNLPIFTEVFPRQ